jgi:hypothetical protein
VGETGEAYGYVGGSPVNGGDPGGLCGCGEEQPSSSDSLWELWSKYGSKPGDPLAFMFIQASGSKGDLFGLGLGNTFSLGLGTPVATPEPIVPLTLETILGLDVVTPVGNLFLPANCTLFPQIPDIPGKSIALLQVNLTPNSSLIIGGIIYPKNLMEPFKDIKYEIFLGGQWNFGKPKPK